MSDGKTDSAPTSFLTLDGMRGIGAFIVVIGHNVEFWNGLSMPTAHICVDLFFLLSGFVIAFAYEPRFAAGMGVATFMRQRFIRLYPLFLLGLLLATAVRLAASIVGTETGSMSSIAGQFFPELFMLPSPDLNDSGDFYALNKPAWTLFFELSVNLVYILAWRWLSTRVLIGFVLLGVASLFWAGAAFGTIDLGPLWTGAIGGLARATFGFFAGVLLYRWAGAPRAPGRKTSPFAFFSILAIPAICFLPKFDAPALNVALDIAVLALVAPGVIWLAQSFQPPKWVMPVFATLGAISYALYMVHYPIYRAMLHLSWRWPELSHELAPWSGLAILVASALLAYLVERYYDRPLRAWINRKLKAQARRSADAAPAQAN